MAEKLIAIDTKHNGRLPVDGEVKVVNREKARHKVALGWSYRFRSGDEWILLPIDETAAFVFENEPDGVASR